MAADFLANLTRTDSCDEPYDAGIVVIDLVARLVMAESTYFRSLDRWNRRLSRWPAGDGDGGSVPPRGRLASLQRRLLARGEPSPNGVVREAAANPPRDVRAVFYGKPLMEFIGPADVRRVRSPCPGKLEAAIRLQWADDRRKWLARQEGVAPEQIDASRLADEEIVPKTWSGEAPSPYVDAIKDIHAAWLLTPRDDLGGKCPREVAMDRHSHLSWDEQDRCEQWSMLGRCPVALSTTSHAYRFAGFGTHELVKYYDLIRELLWFAWDQLTVLDESPEVRHRPASMTVGDFLTTAVPQLEAHLEAWLDAPDPECYGRSPRSLIERERARIPMALSREEAMHDADCPCCQMLADLPGPMFWHLDGCNMDDEFAFDISCKTWADWEEELRDREETDRRHREREDERKRLGVSYGDKTSESSIWTQSFAVEQTADMPLGIRVFGIGCKLAEVLNERPARRIEPAPNCRRRSIATAHQPAQPRLRQSARDPARC